MFFLELPMVRSRILKRPRPRIHTLDSKGEVDNLASRARLAIKIVSGVLALIFTWVQFKDFRVAPLLDGISPPLFLKLILAFYYFCWVSGVSFDVTTQQLVYVKDPRRGQMAWDAVSAVVVLAAVSAILLYASDDDQKFAATLTIFVLANIGL